MAIEPADPGLGLLFVNEVKPKRLPKKFVPAIERGVRGALTSGPIAGYPVIGIRVILRGCTYQEGPDLENIFEAAAFRAVAMALERAEAGVIEPVMQLTITVPQEHSGPVVGDLGRMRGVVTHTEALGSDLIIQAEAPLRETFGYITKLRTMTKGTGSYSMEFLRYAPVPISVQARLAGGWSP